MTVQEPIAYDRQSTPLKSVYYKAIYSIFSFYILYYDLLLDTIEYVLFDFDTFFFNLNKTILMQNSS